MKRVNPYYHSAHWRALRKAALERDGYQCTVEGCGVRATHVDHTETRPPVPYPTAHDVLSNLRSLCGDHDRQVKEKRNGERAQRGEFKVRGCDVDGWPLDPRHAR